MWCVLFGIVPGKADLEAAAVEHEPVHRVVRLDAGAAVEKLDKLFVVVVLKVAHRAQLAKAAEQLAQLVDRRKVLGAVVRGDERALVALARARAEHVVSNARQGKVGVDLHSVWTSRHGYFATLKDGSVELLGALGVTNVIKRNKDDGTALQLLVANVLHRPKSFKQLPNLVARRVRTHVAHKQLAAGLFHPGSQLVKALVRTCWLVRLCGLALGTHNTRWRRLREWW